LALTVILCHGCAGRSPGSLGSVLSGYDYQGWASGGISGVDARRVGLNIGFVDVESPLLEAAKAIIGFRTRYEFTPSAATEQEQLIELREEEGRWERLLLNTGVEFPLGEGKVAIEAYVEYDRQVFLSGVRSLVDRDYYTRGEIVYLEAGTQLSQQTTFENYRIGVRAIPDRTQTAFGAYPVMSFGAGLFIAGYEKPFSLDGASYEGDICDASFDGVSLYVEAQGAREGVSRGVHWMYHFGFLTFDNDWGRGTIRFPSFSQIYGVPASYVSDFGYGKGWIGGAVRVGSRLDLHAQFAFEWYQFSNQESSRDEKTSLTNDMLVLLELAARVSF
jgi:hypothetical protein